MKRSIARTLLLACCLLVGTLAPAQAASYPAGPAGTTISFFLSDPTKPSQPMVQGSGVFWTSATSPWKYVGEDTSGMIYFPWSAGSYQVSTVNQATDAPKQAERITYQVVISANGQIQVTGGSDGSVQPASPGVYVLTSSVPEVADPNSPWTQLQSVPLQTAGHMLLLTDGSVLFHEEGSDQTGTSTWWKLTPDQKGNYLTGTWSQLASTPSNYQPANLASGVLPDGNVILEGGDMNGSSTWVGLNSGAEYSVTNNSWTMINPPNSGTGEFSSIADAPSVVLPNGQFMFGPSGNGDRGAQNQKDVAVFDEKNSTWTVFHGDNRASANPEIGFTLLPNDKVLSISTAYQNADKAADVFDPTTGKWSNTGALPVSLLNPATADGTPIAEIGPAITMPNGKVFAEGSNANTAIYDPSSNTWTAGPNLPVIGGLQFSAADAPSAILPNGDVLLALSPVNSAGESVGPMHFFTFDGKSFTQIGSPFGSNLNQMPAFVTALLPLPNGQVLMTDRGQSSSVYLYTPSGKSNSDWSPRIQSVPTTLNAGGTYDLTGSQLSGLSTGASYGDDWNPNTNYPILQITNKASGQVSYARTFNISSYSIAPNASGKFSFQLPADVSAGAASLRVIASGFASDPVSVTITNGAQSTSSTPVVTASPTPVPTPSSVAVAKSKAKTIVCVKGSSTKKVSGVNPQCPTGFKIKS